MLVRFVTLIARSQEDKPKGNYSRQNNSVKTILLKTYGSLKKEPYDYWWLCGECLKQPT